MSFRRAYPLAFVAILAPLGVVAARAPAWRDGWAGGHGASALLGLAFISALWGAILALFVASAARAAAAGRERGTLAWYDALVYATAAVVLYAPVAALVPAALAGRDTPPVLGPAWDFVVAVPLVALLVGALAGWPARRALGRFPRAPVPLRARFAQVVLALAGLALLALPHRANPAVHAAGPAPREVLLFAFLPVYVGRIRGQPSDA